MHLKKMKRRLGGRPNLRTTHQQLDYQANFGLGCELDASGTKEKRNKNESRSCIRIRIRTGALLEPLLCGRACGAANRLGLVHELAGSSSLSASNMRNARSYADGMLEMMSSSTYRSKVES